MRSSILNSADPDIGLLQALGSHTGIRTGVCAELKHNRPIPRIPIANLLNQFPPKLENQRFWSASALQYFLRTSSAHGASLLC